MTAYITENTENKSGVVRNEFELLLMKIDGNTSYLSGVENVFAFFTVSVIL